MSSAGLEPSNPAIKQLQANTLTIIAMETRSESMYLLQNWLFIGPNVPSKS